MDVLYILIIAFGIHLGICLWIPPTFFFIYNTPPNPVANFWTVLFYPIAFDGYVFTFCANCYLVVVLAMGLVKNMSSHNIFVSLIVVVVQAITLVFYDYKAVEMPAINKIMLILTGFLHWPLSLYTVVYVFVLECICTEFEGAYKLLTTVSRVSVVPLFYTIHFFGLWFLYNRIEPTGQNGVVVLAVVSAVLLALVSIVIGAVLLWQNFRKETENPIDHVSYSLPPPVVNILPVTDQKFRKETVKPIDHVSYSLPPPVVNILPNVTDQIRPDQPTSARAYLDSSITVDELSCPICFDTYEQCAAKGVSLYRTVTEHQTCGHVICADCHAKLLDKKCPMCRTDCKGTTCVPLKSEVTTFLSINLVLIN